VHIEARVYGGDIVAVSDAQFRIGVAAAAVALIAGITYVRFCGALSLPPRPVAASGPTGSQRQLLDKSAASPAIYQEFLRSDAARAGVRAPSLEEMARAFPHRVDDARHVLEVGRPAIESAGLRLAIERADNALVLVVENRTHTDLAYSVVTQPTPNISGCTTARPLAYNALVVASGGSERRVECVWRDGMALAVTRVETLEIPPLSAWYLGLVPPALAGVEPRVARGHRAASSGETCSTVVSQAVRSGLEQGKIGWRDLVDFYARHRCPTYRFPSPYRAVTSDGERPLPAVQAGM
jgi:hypothetical protein